VGRRWGLTDAPSDGVSYARKDGAWAGIPSFATKYTPIDQVKVSDNTYANDAYLVSDTLEADTLYRFELLLITQADAATDFKMRIARTGLSDATLRFAGDLDNAASATLTFNSATNSAGSGVAASPRMGNFIGILKTGTDVGQIAVQWAQQTSGVGETRLLASSMMILRKIVA
jgi:hypothetical protein